MNITMHLSSRFSPIDLKLMGSILGGLWHSSNIMQIHLRLVQYDNNRLVQNHHPSHIYIYLHMAFFSYGEDFMDPIKYCSVADAPYIIATRSGIAFTRKVNSHTVTQGCGKILSSSLKWTVSHDLVHTKVHHLHLVISILAYEKLSSHIN